VKIRVRSRIEEAQIRRHYRQFTQPGSLAFDVGANHGHHTGILVSLGCQVVAVECNRDLANQIGGRRDQVLIFCSAVGAEIGEATMYLNEADVLGTLSERFAHDTEATLGYKTVDTVTVPVTTLDDLRERFGTPDYIKIDVEGYEAEVLKGMSFAPAALGFEFHGTMLDTLDECLCLLDNLNGYEYRVTTGNGFKPASDWEDSSSVARIARRLADGNPALYADVSCRATQ
jgi:FkbM family methyltransferase